MGKFEESLKDGYHAGLAAFEGKWSGNCKTWFEKDVLADESPMTATAEVILGGRFLKIVYNGTLTGKAFEGEMVWGYDLSNNKCQCSWVDSFHMGTGILCSEGSFTNEMFSVLGSYGWPGVADPWGWRTELKYIDKDTFSLTAFNISPEGEEAKATETFFKRS